MAQRGGAATKRHLKRKDAKTQRSQRTESVGGEFLRRRNALVVAARESTQNAMKFKISTTESADRAENGKGFALAGDPSDPSDRSGCLMMRSFCSRAGPCRTGFICRARNEKMFGLLKNSEF